MSRDIDEQRRVSRRVAIADRMAMRVDLPIATHVFADHPIERIIRFTAEHDADLLVIGATEHADFRESIFGRRSERMTHKVGCSVLIIREGGHHAARTA